MSSFNYTVTPDNFTWCKMVATGKLVLKLLSLVYFSAKLETFISLSSEINATAYGVGKENDEWYAYSLTGKLLFIV